MENQELTKNTKLPSSRMTSSRVIKFSFIVIMILCFLYLLSMVAIFILSQQALHEGITEYQAELIAKIADYLHIDVATQIASIASLCVARYGLREFSSNWKNSEYSDNNTTKTKEG